MTKKQATQKISFRQMVESRIDRLKSRWQKSRPIEYEKKANPIPKKTLPIPDEFPSELSIIYQLYDGMHLSVSDCHIIFPSFVNIGKDNAYDIEDLEVHYENKEGVLPEEISNGLCYLYSDKWKKFYYHKVNKHIYMLDDLKREFIELSIDLSSFIQNIALFIGVSDWQYFYAKNANNYSQKIAQANRSFDINYPENKMPDWLTLKLPKQVNTNDCEAIKLNDRALFLHPTYYLPGIIKNISKNDYTIALDIGITEVIKKNFIVKSNKSDIYEITIESKNGILDLTFSEFVKLANELSNGRNDYNGTNPVILGNFYNLKPLFNHFPLDKLFVKMNSNMLEGLKLIDTTDNHNDIDDIETTIQTILNGLLCACYFYSLENKNGKLSNEINSKTINNFLEVLTKIKKKNKEMYQNSPAKFMEKSFDNFNTKALDKVISFQDIVNQVNLYKK